MDIRNITTNSAMPLSAATEPAQIFRTIRRRKYIILASIIICTLFAGYYTRKQPRLYDASARVDIDLAPQRSGISLDSGTQARGSSDMKLATQLGILTSQSLSWEVIKKLKLYQNPIFVGPHPFTGNPDAISDNWKLILIQNFQSGLSAQYERGTEIVQVGYRSTDPQLAASIANALAETYIERNYQNRYTTMLQASTWLNGQLDTLRGQVRTAEEQFADFQKRTGLLQTDETHSAVLDKFNQLNVALSAAETQRILKEIALRASASTDPDLVLPAASLPGLQALRTQLSTLQAEYASLSPKYGDAYPRVAQLKSQIAEVNRAIDLQVKRGREQLSVEYRIAVDDETRLRAAAETQKQQIFSMNENALQYSILQRQVISQRDLYEDLTKKLQEAELTSGLNAEGISVIDPALKPSIPSSPRTKLNLEMGAMIGLFLGLALAFLLENLNNTVRSPEDVALYSGLPLLSLIPHIGSRKNSPENTGADIVRGIYAFDSPQSQFAEAYKTLRSALLLSSAGSPPQVIAICSAWPQEGKSTVSMNLAAVLSQTGKRVLLVDADLRRPSLHLKLGLPLGRLGLSGLLTQEQGSVADEYVIPEPKLPNLAFLSSGKTPPASAELLMSSRMSQLIEQWRGLYDFVVLDTAPFLAVSDTTGIVSEVDTTVLVVRADKTRRQSLRALRSSILQLNGKIAGVALNDVKESSEMYYAYYGEKGNYSAYHSDDQKK